MRLTIGCLKGGVAKTTTAVHLALGLSRTGRTLLVDADPGQSSAQEWAANAGEEWPAEQCSVIAVAARDLARHVRPMVADYDHLVIDVGPKNPSLLRQAMSVTEHTVIPIRPTALDVAGVAGTMEVAIEVDAIHPMTAAVLFADLDSRWVGDERDARELLAKNEVPVMLAKVRHLRRYGVAPGSAPLDDLGDYEDVLRELEATE